MLSNETAAQQDYYRWEIAGRPVVVKLSLDFVDRLLQEVMRGFGSMPRRGVEMGGILLGTIDRSGERPVVVVDDYEPVPCQHSRGATYQLSDDEMVRFQETVSKWAYSEGKQTFAVGYYRSHTREGLGLADEDLNLFNQLLPDPQAICLLIKPFATRVSQAGVFIRENGNVRAQSSYKEFPFRRREMTGSTEPVARPAPPPRAARPGPAPQSQPHRSPAIATATPPLPRSMVPDDAPLGLPTAAVDPKTGAKVRSGWVWIPLSFIFLLLGVILGFQTAMSLRNQLPAGIRPDPYSLHMTVTPVADSLHVRWDRDAGPIHSQARGSLIISDAGAQKIVQLDADQLRNGSVVYRRASNDVRFRLEVQTGDRVAVAETMQFKIESPAR
jgi:hypothetical protein